MLRLILNRLFYGFLVLFGVVSIIFFLFNILPGDPSRMLLGQRSDISSAEAIKKELGLDKPVIYQYLNYLNDISPLSVYNHKDKESYWYLDTAKYSAYIKVLKINDIKLVLKKPYLKTSYQNKRKVTDIIAEAFPNTAILAITAMGFAFIIGLIIGIICAIKKDSLIDKASLIFSVFGMSLPSFFAAILIAWLFAYVLADYTGLNLFGSLYAYDDLGRGQYIELKNLILPALTLGIRPLAIIILLTKNSMLDVLSQDYIRTARAKGLSEIRIIYSHGLKNALNPVITAVSGWFASLLAGAVFVEYIFDWKGIGVVIVDSLEKYDFPVIMGCVLFISVILIIINIFVDILYGIIDPRIKN